MKYSLWIVSVLVLAAVAACNSDPYGGLKSNLVPLQRQEAAKPVTYQVQAPTEVNYTEGSETDFIVTAQTATGGPALVNVINLPQGAGFYPDTGKVVWTPATGTSVDPQSPNTGFRVYTVTVQAINSRNGAVEAQAPVTLVVRPVVETLTVTDQNTDQKIINEGISFSDSFVISDSLAGGHFTVSASGLPSGATLVQSPQDPNRVFVTFLAPYSFVHTTDMCTNSGTATPGCKEIDWQVVVTNTTGKTATSSVQWIVKDMPQAPTISAPAQAVGANGTVTFTVHVEDPNGEGLPSLVGADAVTMTSTITEVQNGPASPSSNAFQYFLVAWPIPTGANTRTQTLNFTSCEVRLDNGTNQACSQASTTVTW